MKNKTLIYILISIFLMGIVSAVQVTNVLSPTPDGTTTTTRTIDFKFTLDEEPVGCWIEIGLSNGTTLGNHTAGEIGTTKSGKQYLNSSYAIPIDSSVSGSHNWSMFCGATAVTSTIVNTFDFNIKVNTPTATSPTVLEVKSSKTVVLNMTIPIAINATLYKCQYNVTLSNGTSTGWKDLASTDNATWYNSTYSSGIDSAAADYHEVTYRCNDSSGYSTAALINFKVDSTNPSYTWANITRSASVATYKAAVTDNTGLTCTASLYDNTGTITATLSGTSEGTGSSKNCTYTLTGAQIAIDGVYNLEAIVVDEASNTATKVNKSGVMQILYAGWNLITWADTQANLSTICTSISGCTSTSWYNNTAQSFSTYASTTPSVNAGVNVPAGEAFHIYVSSNTYALMDDYLPESASDENISIYVGWNTFGLTQSTKMNTTLNASANFTFASVYEASVETYYTCSETLDKCAGTTNAPGDILLEKGSAIWMLSNANVTINRTGVSG